MGNSNKTNSYTEFFYKAFRNILIIGIPLVVISAIILSSLRSSATGSTSGSDNLAITISSSCTLSSVVNIPHNAEVYNGNYLENIGKTTITTLCNDGNGYSVYANGYSNNEEGNNKLINNSYPQYSIDTGLATSGLTSTWAMKLNNIPDDPSPTPPTIESDYNNTYGIVPPYWTKVASRASGTTDMAEGSSFTTTYAVYASSSQYAGTYQGQVKYALLHPYKNDNVMSFENSFALHGKEKILMEGTTNEYYTMQDMNSDICNSVGIYNEASQTQLVDIRDNKLYWVAKLDDGHCWMTQNLDFVINSNTMLNSETTDLNVAYNSTTGNYPEYNNRYTVNNNIVYWKPASSATTRNFAGTTVTGWGNSSTEPYSANKTDSDETGHASLGNYYNWTAVIASNNSSSLTQDTLNNIADNPKNSICPKGWRLPTISNQSETTNSTNEFARLNYLYNDNSHSTYTGLVSSPLYFVLAGAVSWDGGIQEITIANGFAWSSTSGDNTTAYYLRINNNGGIITNDNAGGRYNGRTTRCIAR